MLETRVSEAFPGPESGPENVRVGGHHARFQMRSGTMHSKLSALCTAMTHRSTMMVLNMMVPIAVQSADSFEVGVN